MRKKCFVGCLALSVVAAEAVEARTLPEITEAGRSLVARDAESLVANPHVHFEAGDESRPTTVAPYSISGGWLDASYRLWIYPFQAGFRLVGTPFTFDDSRPPELSAYFHSIDTLAKALLNTDLVTLEQVAKLRHTALKGEVQEIGGSGGANIRFFKGADLEHLGMTDERIRTS
jgi:hypothetical protein